jgi:serine/threonine protein kinase
MTHSSQNALLGRAVAGRFTITRLLGEGGMATVYAAEQEAEPREVALKIMNDSRAADRGFVKRFQREAKAAARVKHANSVRILDYGVTDDGLSYIAMELVRGDNLYTLLEREGALSEQRAARILAEVCDVLAEAHALGIVHRDLKPENIMLIADPAHANGERVKVLDFGIAKIMEPEVKPAPKVSGESGPDSGVTRAGTLLGTPAYMSPEQCSLEAVDTRADLYTCGVLLFQLITGALPFEGQTPLHTA